MLRTVLIAAAVFCLAGSASAKERSFVLGGFEQITVEGDIVVEITTGASPSAMAEGTQDQLDRVRLVRNGKRLTARLLSPVRTGRDNADITGPLVIRLATRELSEISLRGNGIVNTSSLEGRAVRVQLTGNGQIMAGSLDADQLYINVAGAGTISVNSGEAREGHVQLTGPANWRADGLTLDRLDLNHSGPATSSVAVEEFATITNSGTGSVAISGEADCDIRSTGSAQIICGNGEDFRQP